MLVDITDSGNLRIHSGKEVRKKGVERCRLQTFAIGGEVVSAYRRNNYVFVRCIMCKRLICLVSFVLVLCVSGEAIGQAERTEMLLAQSWRFEKGDPSGAEQPGFDDSSWRTVSVPHDWSIEDLEGQNHPFDPDAINSFDVGYTVGGTGWYRKAFTVPPKLQGKRFHLQFDGVYMNADVWLNGQHLGNHPYGYTSFWYDITDKIKFGHENILAVEVKNEGKNTRWYSGSGIYRHVWLTVMESIHVAHWGTYIVTPEVNKSSAKVQVRTQVVNATEQQKTVTIRTRILDLKGFETSKTETNQTLQRKSSSELNQILRVKSPKLWSTESPVLYTAVTELLEKLVLTLGKVTKAGHVYRHDSH